MCDIYNSKIAALVGRLNGNTRWAVTISKGCTLYSVGSSEVGIEWRRHEDCHKRQIADEGWLLFMLKYFMFLAIKGYQMNPYEIEARLAANDSNEVNK